MYKFINILLFIFCINNFVGAQAKPLYAKQVYFEFNKYDLRPDDGKALSAFMRAIKAQQQAYFIKLTGHTDNIDNDRYNQNLGLQRALAVKNYLTQRGVAEEYIQVQSKGEKAAVKDNKTDSGRALNRRVEMELFAGTGAPAASVATSVQPNGSPSLTGRLYDAETRQPVTGNVTVTIKNPRELDKDKNKQHKNTQVYVQGITKDREYTVYVTADGYRAESYTLTVSADQTGTLVQNAYLKKLNIKERLNYEKIYFVPNKDEFLTTAHEDLQKLLKFMQNDTTTNIEIRGHINFPLHRSPPMSPFEEYLFYDLSLRRAIAVYNYLVHYGINRDRMSYRGMSNKEMVMPYAKTLEESMKNMRVEVLVLN